MNRVFVDTETSGLAPGQIGQLAIITETDTGEVRGDNYFFKIDYIDEGAMKVTGRDLAFYEKASNGKVFKDFADEIFEKLSHGVLIAHNLKFDENFISTEFWRINKVFRPEKRFDTMEFFTDICQLPAKRAGERFKRPKLSELVDFYNIDSNKIGKYCSQLFNCSDSDFHGATFDTTAMFIAFQIYNEKLKGSNTWEEAFRK